MRGVTQRQLVDMFLRERAVFARSFPAALDVGLIMESRHFVKNPRPRDLAWFDPKDNCVHMMFSSLERDIYCLCGIVRHELGHAVDERLHQKGAERRADRLAEIATGLPILYTPDGIQNSTYGVPYRPDWLHQ
jgi:hypothetical protein